MHPRTFLEIVRKYGVLDFTKIVCEMILAKISNKRINRFFYNSAIRSGLPYFGEYLEARQGVLRRHAFMSRLAHREFSRLKGSPLKVLEVGSYAGASAITWALGLKESGTQGRVYCVDPWSEYLGESARVAKNRKILVGMAQALNDGKVRELFEHNLQAMGVEDMVEPLPGLFRNVSKQLPSESFDLIYIDGNHSVSEVEIDLAEAGRLLKPGGILCGDDLEIQFSDVDQEFCRQQAENDVAVDPKTKVNYHPGVTLAVHRFFKAPVSVYNGFFLMRKTRIGWDLVSDLGVYSSRDLPPHLRWWNIKMLSLFSKKSKSDTPKIRRAS